MKKILMLFAFACITFSACKKDKKTLEFDITGREYAAVLIESGASSRYVHLKFNGNGKVVLSTSIDKIPLYATEELTYTKSRDTYNIKGVLTQTVYLTIGTQIDWTITPSKHPTYEGSTIKSSFELNGLTFIDQRP